MVILIKLQRSKTMKKLSVVVLAFIFLAASIMAQDRGIQFEPETLGLSPGSSAADLNIDWYANTGRGNVSQVRIFDTKGTLITTASGMVINASQGKVAHKVTVTGLLPDTQYRYSVTNDGNNWSDEYNYRTPAQGRFIFAYVGDPQLTRGEQDKTSKLFSADKSTARGWNDTLVKIASRGVNFIAGVGDQVDTAEGGDEVEYRNFFAPVEFRSIPFAPAVGNHDRHYLFQYHFNLPNEQKFDPIVNSTNNNSTEIGTVEAAGNYWYLYNNALFVVLNSSAYPDSAAAARSYIERFDKTLSAAVSANKGKFTWLFVQHHKSTASVAQHIADKDIQYYVETGFEKLMDKYNVDFVLAGHDHVYARSFVMKDGKPVNKDKDKFNNPGGTIYLTATTASGLKYYNVFDADGLYEKNNADYPYLVNGLKGSAAYLQKNLPLSTNIYLQNKKPGYAIIEVSGNIVTFNVYDIDSNKPIDSFTVTK